MAVQPGSDSARFLGHESSVYARPSGVARHRMIESRTVKVAAYSTAKTDAALK
jgi:hypothetical protein